LAKQRKKIEFDVNTIKQHYVYHFRDKVGGGASFKTIFTELALFNEPINKGSLSVMDKGPSTK